MKQFSVFDLTPRVSDKRRSVLRARHPKNALTRGPFYGIAALIYRAAKEIRSKENRSCTAATQSHSVLLYASTKNQMRALLPVHEHLRNESVLVSDYRMTHTENELETEPLGTKRNLSGVIRSPTLVKDFIFAPDSFSRWSLIRCFDQYAHALGSYYSYLAGLKRLQPTAIVISNDYSAAPRSFAAAARSLGIVTIYIPHALIGTKHYSPPPPITDIVLYGNNTEKERILERCRQSSLTPPDFLPFPRYHLDSPTKPPPRTVQSIGLSINQLDTRDEIQDAVDQCILRFPNLKNIIIRPHPSLRPTDYSYACSHISLTVNRGPLERFFDEIDLHIAGSSMMHLNALQNGVPTAITDDGIQKDHYGFYNLGLAKKIQDASELDPKNLLGGEIDSALQSVASPSHRVKKAQAETISELKKRLHLGQPPRKN